VQTPSVQRLMKRRLGNVRGTIVDRPENGSGVLAKRLHDRLRDEHCRVLLAVDLRETLAESGQLLVDRWSERGIASLDRVAKPAVAKEALDALHERRHLMWAAPTGPDSRLVLDVG
jgi:hypothetical protein